MTIRNSRNDPGAGESPREKAMGVWPCLDHFGLDRRTFLGCAISLAEAAAFPFNAVATPLAYDLKAIEIAPDTYAVYGAQEYFSLANGGNIVNVAFVVTGDGVVVIDTGPSLRYGEALKALIHKTAKRGVVRVYITHHHPDHIFGNQAFDPTTIASLPQVIANMKVEGETFSDNMYRLVGDWMRGTQLVLPTKALGPNSERFGNHEFELMAFGGHTSSDLVLLDKSTGVLFAGDIAFLDRAPTTPHADLERWQKSLNKLEKSSFGILLPGHGPAEKGKRAIGQTKDYLTWLENTLRQSAENGLDMNETMAAPIPKRLQSIALIRDEMGRSVAHLYAKFEEPILPIVSNRS